jgi:diguanylate cyclase (GGDEF)-like protein
MNVTLALNSILGSLLLQILIFADYTRKYNTDVFQRSVFLRTLALMFVTGICDLLFLLLTGQAKTWVFHVLNAVMYLYFIFQITGYFYLFIFVDYIAYKNSERTRKFMLAAWLLIIIHTVILLFNVDRGFYFYISRDSNTYHYGSLYAIRIIASALPAVLSIFDFAHSLAVKDGKFKKTSVCIALMYILSIGASSIFDIKQITSALLWPVITAMLLYTYFFIIRQDARIDTLTRIGNRFALEEFIDKLSRQTTKESWAIIMLDMDHFKQINDTLGHAAGDMALRDMGEIIKGSIGSADFAARYGGDEFVIAAKSDPPALLLRLQEAVQKFNEQKKRDYQIQMSFGYDIFVTGTDQLVQDCLGHIDSLMYAQKKYKMNRRGRISVVPPSAFLSGDGEKREAGNV